MPEDQPTLFSQITLYGSTIGNVKNLSGFDRKRHTLPDAINSHTLGFLAKICEEEFEEEAESKFQSLRSVFEYKRKDITLNGESPMAIIETKDFTLSIRYEFEPDDPSEYLLIYELTNIESPDLLESEIAEEALGSLFDELRFHAQGHLSVEAVIDAIEDEDDEEMTVDFPSNCVHCDISLESTDVEIRVTPHNLSLRFPRQSQLKELFDGFESVCDFFTRNEALSTALVPQSSK